MSRRALVWDEQQPAQKEAYPDFLGNAIANWLKSRPGIEARSVKLDDPQQGLADEDLTWANVFVWWGHVRHGEIAPETAQKKIVGPILAGRLALVALHSAHWSTPASRHVISNQSASLYFQAQALTPYSCSWSKTDDCLASAPHLCYFAHRVGRRLVAQ